MNTLKHTIILFFPTFFGIVLIFSCGTEPEDQDASINPNIIKIKDCCSGEGLHGDFHMGSFEENRIYFAGVGVGYFEINNDFDVVKDSVFRPINIEEVQGEKLTYISSLNSAKDFLLITSIFGDVSLGNLYEYDTSSNEVILLRDSTYRISTAVYWHGDDSKLIYYSYGNEKEAGYYLYNKTTDTDSLLLAHRSPIGPGEGINGFDLSPDNTKLLYPNVRAFFTNPQGPQTPQIVEYNLQNQQADTFNIEFDLSFVRIGLWFRYSSSGDRILYCNFPKGAFTPTTNDDSEVEIIELPARTKQILDVNTNPGGAQRSVQLAPTWSPDGRHIVYGSGKLASESGAKGSYSPYILKNVNDPDNYINQP